MIVYLNSAKRCQSIWTLPNGASLSELRQIVPVYLNFAKWCQFIWTLPNSASLSELCQMVPVYLNSTKWCQSIWTLPNGASLSELCQMVPVYLNSAVQLLHYATPNGTTDAYYLNSAVVFVYFWTWYLNYLHRQDKSVSGGQWECPVACRRDVIQTAGRAHLKMINCFIGKDMSSLHFGLDVFCLFDVGAPGLDAQPLPQKYWGSCGSVHTASKSGTVDSNGQNTSSPKYNDDISLLI